MRCIGSSSWAFTSSASSLGSPSFCYRGKGGLFLSQFGFCASKIRNLEPLAARNADFVTWARADEQKSDLQLERKYPQLERKYPQLERNYNNCSFRVVFGTVSGRSRANSGHFRTDFGIIYGLYGRLPDENLSLAAFSDVCGACPEGLCTPPIP